METTLVKVNYIIDGDTFIGSVGKRRNYYRARWIDAPELRKKSNVIPEMPDNLSHWLWAERSRLFLADLLRLCPNWNLTIVPNKIDSYQRVLCDWYIGEPLIENNVQVSMCLGGMATSSLPFQQYYFPNNDLDLYIGILKATAEACRDKAGFWSEPNFIVPAEFKRRYRVMDVEPELELI